MTNPFDKGEPKGFLKKGKPSVESDNLHKRSDLDSSDQAQHHSLGFKSGQAAPGSKVQELLDAIKAGAFGRVGDYQFNDDPTETDVWKIANGQLLNIADYPEAYALYGTTHGGDGVTTFGLPNVKSRYLRPIDAAGIFGKTVGEKSGNDFTELAHTHTTPNHNHTGAAHTHGITGAVDHQHTIAQAGAMNSWALGNSGVNSTARLAQVESHNHGGNTGSGGAHDHGAATGGASAGNTGNAAPTTNNNIQNNNFWGDTIVVALPPYYATYCFVRVKLGI